MGATNPRKVESFNRKAVKAIEKKFGTEAIKAKQQELCTDCRFTDKAGECDHNLVPICLDGSDCIYRQPKGV